MDNQVDELENIKKRWLGDALHSAGYWADHAGRDIPWLIEQLEAERAKPKMVPCEEAPEDSW
jgi:hypothetical protein